MRKTRAILRLKWQQGRSHREIATVLSIGAGTPSDVAVRARAAGLDSWAVEALSDDELERKLYREPAVSAMTTRARADPAQIHIELRRPSVTLRLLHEEYIQPVSDLVDPPDSATGEGRAPGRAARGSGSRSGRAGARDGGGWRVHRGAG